MSATKSLCLMLLVAAGIGLLRVFTPTNASVITHFSEGQGQGAANNINTPAVGCAPMPSNAVAWWPFDGNTKDFVLTPGLKGATTTGNPAFVSGKIDQALLFDGNDDHAKVNRTTSLDVGTAGGFTIELWINPADVAHQRPLVEWGDGTLPGQGTHFWIAVPIAGGGPGSLYANLVDTNGVAHFISSSGAPVLTAGTYQHVALVFNKNPAIAILYVNGNQVATQVLGAPFTPRTYADLYFGMRPFAPGEHYQGQMDEIAIFNRPLSQSEIQSIVSAGTNGKCKIRYVTNTGDNGGIFPSPGDGTGTLRQAIADSEAYGASSFAVNTIGFNIGSGGNRTITPISSFGQINGAVTIDGTTQPGFAGAPLIELDGTNQSGSVALLCIAPVTIKGLVINRWSIGIRVGLSSSSGSRITGNYIGTDPTGTFARPNNVGIDVVASSNVLIGGTDPTARNVISGNSGAGVQIFGNGNVIQGNYIGINAAGNGTIGNGSMAIYVAGDGTGNNTIGGTVGTTPGGPCTGACNVISGNLSGIWLINGTTNNLVQGNFIGTDVTGTLDFGNVGQGIMLGNSSIPTNDLIGGAVPAARNIISGNGDSGINIQTPGNSIQGNYIGVDATGTQPLGNSRDGIVMGAGFNQIGGATASAGNLISGNFRNGIQIGSNTGTGNFVQGNLIGTNAAGTAALGNSQHGVLVGNFASMNVIGLDSAGGGLANRIAFNGGTGVTIDAPSSIRNRVSGNSIFANSDIGIDLSPPTGVTQNDPGDGDSGGNNLQNFPSLTSAMPLTGMTTIQGTLNSTPGQSFRVEFFSNSSCDASGNGEGQTSIGFTNVNTNGAGNANINVALPLSVPIGQFITSTATDVNGNTSEFSACVMVTSPTAAHASIRGSVIDSNGAPLGGVLLTLSGASTLRRAITDSQGRYSFSEVEVNNFYSVTPLLANYVLTPSIRAFSLFADVSDATFTGIHQVEIANPLDTAEYFVRQQYLDFLGREPDQGGWEYWSEQLRQCGDDTRCLNQRRIDIANAFFTEAEYGRTGAYVFRLYRAAFGDNQPFPNPDPGDLIEARKIPAYSVFLHDRATVLDGPNLSERQVALATSITNRPEFLARYPMTLDGPAFVDALLANIEDASCVSLVSQRDALISLFNQGGRGPVLYRLACEETRLNPIDNRAFIDAEYNRAFVYSEYGGYLKRDADIGGFVFWLDQIDRFPLRDAAIQRAMICAFVTSAEYQQRFSSVVTRSNSQCGR